jgi:hypothetical protein
VLLVEFIGERELIMEELTVNGLEERGRVLVLALGSVEFWFCCCLIGSNVFK